MCKGKAIDFVVKEGYLPPPSPAADFGNAATTTDWKGTVTAHKRTIERLRGEIRYLEARVEGLAAERDLAQAQRQIDALQQEQRVTRTSYLKLSDRLEGVEADLENCRASAAEQAEENYYEHF